MRKLYEIFKLLWIQKRIVAAAIIWGNTVYGKLYIFWKCAQFQKMWNFHFRFFVNTTGRVVSGSFRINSNRLTDRNHHAKLSFIQAKIIEESKTQNLDRNNGISHAKNLRKAMVSKYQGRWFVCAVENDEYYSVSVSSGYKEYLDLTYKGVRWIIFSY